jgi:hypothetical protein
MNLPTVFSALVIFQLFFSQGVFAQSAAPTKKEIKSFTFIPATRPLKYQFGASSWTSSTQPAAPLSSEDATALRLTQSDLFEDAMIALNLTLDTQLNTALESELKLLGYQLKPIENLKRRLLQPDWVDYKSIKFDADALLQVSFYGIGVYRPRDGSAYYPRLNVSGYVFLKGQKKAAFDNSVYLGIDADEKNALLFVGKDPKKGYVSFIDLISNLETLKDTYQRAIPLLAKELAKDIHRTINVSVL